MLLNYRSRGSRDIRSGKVLGDGLIGPVILMADGIGVVTADFGIFSRAVQVHYDA